MDPNDQIEQESEKQNKTKNVMIQSNLGFLSYSNTSIEN